MNRERELSGKWPAMDGMSCPLPLSHYSQIVIGHGGGGKLSAELVEQLFRPAFQNEVLDQMGDSAVLPFGTERLAFSTDSYVIRPLVFPGGNIGILAVNGTINDLAMSGAKPLFLSVGLILEEGLPMSTLAMIVNSMGDAARAAGVQIVTGDTKVVERGHGDGCYINTAGIGVVRPGARISVDQARAGDAILLSGTIGDHGMAVLSVREGLEFEAAITSDTAPLHHLVNTMLDACPNIHVLRDPTRGGVATALNEIAAAANVGVVIDEAAIPVNSSVQAACDLLGLDPLFVANEGKLLAVVPSESAEIILEAMRRDPLGTQARIIGRIVTAHPTMVVARTAIGSTRVVTTQLGEPLPRIC